MLGNRNGPARWWSILPLLLLALGAASLFGAGVAFAGQANSPAEGRLEQTSKPGDKTEGVDGAGLSIPDQGTVTGTTTIVSAAVITDIDVVNVTISHTFPGDLDVYLMSPAGTSVELFTDVCGGTDWNAANTDFDLSDGALEPIGSDCPPGSGLYRPEGSLSAFNGQPAAGIWRLVITDDSAEDTGVLVDWGLAFNGAAVPAQPTNTPAATATLVPTRTPVLAPESFTDVAASDYFYDGVRFLVGKGAISGYNDAAHCGSAVPCYQPFATVTRGQFAKIVVLGMDIPAVGSPPIAGVSDFTDVPPSNPFYLFVNSARTFGIVSGYDDAAHCGTAVPCFQPFQPITRAQLTKMVIEATGWDLEDPATPTFSDVPATDPFYEYIETAVEFGVISGYSDGTFKPFNNATRGQVSKMVYLAYTTPSGASCSAGGSCVQNK